MPELKTVRFDERKARPGEFFVMSNDGAETWLAQIEHGELTTVRGLTAFEVLEIGAFMESLPHPTEQKG